MDALRTRSELACFRESPEVQRRVERLLTYYCKTSGISCVPLIDEDRGMEGERYVAPHPDWTLTIPCLPLAQTKQRTSKD